MEKTQLLREQNIEPTNEVILKALGKAYSAYAKFIDYVKNDLIVDWHYYNDGKAWLGKVQTKKKTVFWLSVWQDFFMVTFYFTKKTRDGIQELNIAKNIKEKITNAKTIGKLIPLIFEIKEECQLQDLFSIIDYKKNLK